MSSWDVVDQLDLGDLRTPAISYIHPNTKVTISLDPTFKGLPQLEELLKNKDKASFMDVELPIQIHIDGPCDIDALNKAPFWAKIRANHIFGQISYSYYLLGGHP